MCEHLRQDVVTPENREREKKLDGLTDAAHLPSAEQREGCSQAARDDDRRRSTQGILRGLRALLFVPVLRRRQHRAARHRHLIYLHDEGFHYFGGLPEECSLRTVPGPA